MGHRPNANSAVSDGLSTMRADEFVEFLPSVLFDVSSPCHSLAHLLLPTIRCSSYNAVGLICVCCRDKLSLELQFRLVRSLVRRLYMSRFPVQRSHLIGRLSITADWHLLELMAEFGTISLVSAFAPETNLLLYLVTIV